jgi:hypothetical protein
MTVRPNETRAFATWETTEVQKANPQQKLSSAGVKTYNCVIGLFAKLLGKAFKADLGEGTVSYCNKKSFVNF